MHGALPSQLRWWAISVLKAAKTDGVACIEMTPLPSPQSLDFVAFLVCFLSTCDGDGQSTSMSYAMCSIQRCFALLNVSGLDVSATSIKVGSKACTTTSF